MTDDKIAEIRARHALSASWSTGYSDRATLLAEVDRQRAEIEQLRDEDTKTRHALKKWVYVCPDGGDEPTHERVSAVVAEVEKQRAEIERLRAALRDIERGDYSDPMCERTPEQRARNALEGKP